jgi:hypothetical protein
MSVATVGPGSRIALKKITIGRDFGSSVEVSTGLSRNDRVVDSPPDFLEQGSLVRIGGAMEPQERCALLQRDSS